MTFCSQVIQNKNYCPTILTRDGNRLHSSGKFGGAQNKAPPRDIVKKFGAPLPQSYYTLQKEIGDRSYTSLMNFFVTAQSDYAYYIVNFVVE